VQPWRTLVRELAQHYPHIWVIFSCRSLDYSASLSSRDLPVPQVRIESLSDAQVEEFVHLYCPDYGATLYPTGRQTQPAFWKDNAFNNPAQPVVGICWFEARAYCAWLSAQTGKHFRLPTEAEWEAAARGQQGRRYAFGDDFDASRCNTFETHSRRTTPTGVFPGGVTPEGVVDLTGNVWEWASSQYRVYP
jgi:formylglycine-generating enzyme required for sulfatase activity